MSVTGLKIAMMAMTKTVALVQVGVQKLRAPTTAVFFFWVQCSVVLFLLEICIRIAVFLFIFFPHICVCAKSNTRTVCISSLGYCYSYQYECDSGECISNNDVCDGTEDCYDGSDEDGCAGAGGRAKYCVASQFLRAPTTAVVFLGAVFSSLVFTRDM